MERSRGQLLKLPPRDLQKAVEGTDIKLQRTENIQLGRIYAEDVIVDAQHARDLGNAVLHGAWLQTLPVLVRCRLNGNGIVYDWLDGQHRIKGVELVLKEQGKPWDKYVLETKVLYNCTDEEKWDQRILAANSVKSVKFARMGRWIKEAWDGTIWGDSLTATQAFGLFVQDSSGKKLGLGENDIVEIKKWVEEKSKKWLSSPGSIYGDLRLTDVADPELVKRVRSGTFVGGGVSLSRKQFAVVVDAFPNDFKTQRTVANLASALHYNTEELSQIVGQLKKKKTLSRDIIQETMKSGPTGSRLYESDRGIRLNTILKKVRDLRTITRRANRLIKEDKQEIDHHLGEAEKIIKKFVGGD